MSKLWNLMQPQDGMHSEYCEGTVIYGDPISNRIDDFFDVRLGDEGCILRSKVVELKLSASRRNTVKTLRFTMSEHSIELECILCWNARQSGFQELIDALLWGMAESKPFIVHGDMDWKGRLTVTDMMLEHHFDRQDAAKAL